MRLTCAVFQEWLPDTNILRKCGSWISVQKHDCLSGFSTGEKSFSDDPFQPQFGCMTDSKVENPIMFDDRSNGSELKVSTSMLRKD